MAMLDALNDGQFWLPPQFLADGDDDFLAAAAAKKGLDPGSNPCCRFGPCGGYSGLGSPVESVFGSTETESDEEDFVIADLTRIMAGSALGGEGLKKPNFSDFAPAYSKGRCLSVSPQSTLCGCCQSPLPFQASSPPGGWDLLREAAVEAAKMRLHKLQQLHELEHGTSVPGHYFYPRKIAAIPVPPAKNPNSNVNLYPHQSLSYQQMLFDQQMKQQQQQRDSGAWGSQPKATQQQQRMAVHQVARDDDAVVCTRNGGGRTTLGMSPSAWPSLQQSQRQPQQSGLLQHHQLQNGTGMRAAFLGAPPAAAKRESAGTGVFLPRRAGSQPEPRKKHACPTVLVPAKVVQALNMNLSSRHSQHSQPGLRTRRLAPEADDGVWKFPASGPCAQPRRNLRAQPAMGHEARLPQEWTY
ncbi:uncharacterized protein LOC115734647 isoform X2 [Rhodamnia argentea]|uniref:Uncharacterized protein LOC115734647 isoform X2 n=1 Tax=Rhodamnia argentea TaxID=178133 RepID=A0A8B8NGS9_9MYRT|nr:uncharacterized protein LOC115734647 isoform X2 [Rhodamnia argentea]